MNINNLWKKITEKWPAKLICLVLAIFLYILHQTSLLDKKTFIVPLDIIEDGNVSIIGHVPDSVSVVVRSNRDDLARISTGDIKADINLNAIVESGKYTLPVNLKFSNQLLSYDPFEVKVKQEEITVDVEKKVIRYIPVVSSTVGDVAHGYKIADVEVSPSYVPVTGPESIVYATNVINTSRVNVSNATTNFTVEAECVPVSKLIEIMEPGPYKVTVTLEQEESTRDFNEIVVVLNNLADNLMIEGATPLINVTLSGKIPYLEKYVIGRNFVTADFSEITEPGIYDIPLKFSTNPNFEIIKKSAETINVKIIEKQLQNSEESTETDSSLENESENFQDNNFADSEKEQQTVESQQ